MLFNLVGLVAGVNADHHRSILFVEAGTVEAAAQSLGLNIQSIDDETGRAILVYDHQAMDRLEVQLTWLQPVIPESGTLVEILDRREDAHEEWRNEQDRRYERPDVLDLLRQALDSGDVRIGE